MDKKIEHGMDIVRDMLLQNINSLIRRFSKQVLQRLEDQRLLTPAIRKCVLDGFNDLYREITK